MSKKIPSEKISKQFGRAIKRLGERIPTNQPKQPQGMSKEKTFEAIDKSILRLLRHLALETAFYRNRPQEEYEIFPYPEFREIHEIIDSYVNNRNRQEILKVIDRFEDEEIADRLKVFYMRADGTYKFPNSKEGDLLKMVHEQNSRVKELRKEYE